MNRIFYMLLAMLPTFVSAQNITDIAVMNSQTSMQEVEQSDWSAMEDTVFLHPDRVCMDNRCVQLEGKDVFILSGTMHYFRVAEPLWRDRLVKLKDMGCNTVETYVPWNWHERKMPTSIRDFSKIDLGELERFLKLAEDLGLYVIVRPGPYICAEWKGGGFPQWLMRKRPSFTKSEVWLQSDDPDFCKWSEHWYKAVAKVVAPHQIWCRKPNTGGVIFWQIENEYNRVKWVSNKAKRNYLTHLALVSRRNGIEVPFITCWTSEARDCKDGPLNGCVDMVNSYPRWQIEKSFGRLINQQLQTMPGKPLISGELQGGWYSAIGGKLSAEQDGVSAVQTQNLTLYALQRGFCALNFYMMVGGTNFDDWASREAITTYDFAAAIGEDGSLRPRYDRLQNLADFLKEHGTKIARANLKNIVAETSDSLVHVSLRMAANGDRYFFVRTEERTIWHRGTINVDGCSFDYELEPFGSLVYYMPAGQRSGRWFPSCNMEKDRKPEIHQRSLTAVSEFWDRLPQKWTALKNHETVNDLGIYGYHPIYFRFRAKEGQMVEVGYVGNKQVNGSIADQVVMMCDGKIIAASSADKHKITFRLPGTKGKTRVVNMLYLSPGLHHHTNKVVEQYWDFGPRYVKVNGRDVALGFANTEFESGKNLSQPNGDLKAKEQGLVKWYRYKFKTNGNSIYHLRLSHIGNGFIYVNGKCIGRCWQQGPQHDYYIPECWLNEGKENFVAVSLCYNNGEAPKMFNAEIVETFRTRVPVINAINENVEKVKAKIDTLVNRHLICPEWILSRMAMYWKEGERYTQCYIGGQRWLRGEGNAPVPTLRLPGERTWNKWKRPALEELTPYNETGDLLCKDSQTDEEKWIDYNHSGHSVRSINGEILQLAIEAAYVFWNTKEDKYARFAADIFCQALMGVYYMKPVINETPEDVEGKGGWTGGGILGYYDYEQIHDDIGFRLATIYDYLADYLYRHPTKTMLAIGKDVKRITNEVMRRFVDIGMVRGGKNGNWNVNGWDMILRPILVLEDNDYFDDGKGRNYFLHYLLKESTPYHNCIPDMLKQYDPITGLWPESPGYGFGTALCIKSWQKSLMACGEDVVGDNQVLQKAIDAIPVWSDWRGKSICFGDFRGGQIGKDSPVGKMGWTASSFSPFHRMAVLKNFDDSSFPMMACLYGGRAGSHLSKNGLAVQFYGFGYALAPDASAYESYWSADYNYHQSVEGANTITPGYEEGEVKLNEMYPSVDPLRQFYAKDENAKKYQLADMTAGEKRRRVILVKAGKGKGYYVDIFSPGVENSRYIMHTVGRDVKVHSPKKDGSCVVDWDVSDSISVRLWVSGGTRRKYSTSMKPASYIDASLTPNGVSTGKEKTPTFYSEQTAPVVYANIYEPYLKGKPTISKVEWIYENGNPKKMLVTHFDGSKRTFAVDVK